MPKYSVKFIKQGEVEIEADTQEHAEQKAMMIACFSEDKMSQEGWQMLLETTEVEKFSYE